jgi:hypothetical protein
LDERVTLREVTERAVFQYLDTCEAAIGRLHKKVFTPDLSRTEAALATAADAMGRNFAAAGAKDLTVAEEEHIP